MQTLTFLVNSIDDPRIFNVDLLTGAFRELDKDNSGTLSLEELKQGFSEMKVPSAEVERIFSNVDFGHAGEINYSEFLAVTVDKRKALAHSNLMFAFHHFDTDQSGFITPDNLKECFRREGKHLSDTEVDMMVAEVNPQTPGQVTL